MDGDWISTYTGQFHPFAPQADEVRIVDIAHSLSMLCRFNGHCRRFYSVAEHSYWVADRLLHEFGSDVALVGLLHDAAEAYLGDIVRPLKRRLSVVVNYSRFDGRMVGSCEQQTTSIVNVEAQILAAVGQALKVEMPHPLPVEIGNADLRMLATEKAQLFGPGPSWGDLAGVEPYGVTLPCWAPRRARLKFTAMWCALSD
jgi:hypothetical protein